MLEPVLLTVKCKTRCILVLSLHQDIDPSHHHVSYWGHLRPRVLTVQNFNIGILDREDVWVENVAKDAIYLHRQWTSLSRRSSRRSRQLSASYSVLSQAFQPPHDLNSAQIPSCKLPRIGTCSIIPEGSHEHKVWYSSTACYTTVKTHSVGPREYPQTRKAAPSRGGWEGFCGGWSCEGTFPPGSPAPDHPRTRASALGRCRTMPAWTSPAVLSGKGCVFIPLLVVFEMKPKAATAALPCRTDTAPSGNCCCYWSQHK